MLQQKCFTCPDPGHYDPVTVILSTGTGYGFNIPTVFKVGANLLKI